MKSKFFVSCDTRRIAMEFEKPLHQITLEAVRTLLIEQNFFPNGDAQNYRFVFPEATKEAASFADRVLGKNLENIVTVNTMLLPTSQELVIANINTKSTEPHYLIGFHTPYWGNETMQVTCRLKPGQNAADTPEPILMADVITAREKDFYKVHLPNVVVCVQGSTIEFPIAAPCTVGIAYRAWQNGDDFFDYASPLDMDRPDSVAYGCISCYNHGQYSDHAHFIKVEKLSEFSGGNEKAVPYEVTIEVRDVTQYSLQHNGKTFATYTEKDKTSRKTAVRMACNAMTEEITDTEQQIVIGPHSYFKGHLTPGEEVPGVPLGSDTFSVDKLGEVIGTMSICLLVFKDLETANTYVARYNLL